MVIIIHTTAISKDRNDPSITLLPPIDRPLRRTFAKTIDYYPLCPFQICLMLNSLENYVWRYNSAVELVNLIFTYIEQNALRVSIAGVSHAERGVYYRSSPTVFPGFEPLRFSHALRIAGAANHVQAARSVGDSKVPSNDQMGDQQESVEGECQGGVPSHHDQAEKRHQLGENRAQRSHKRK